MRATDTQIEAAAKQAYENNRAGEVEWRDVPEKFKNDWRAKVRSVVEAALNAK